MSAVLSYLELTKPRLLPMVLFSGLPALVMATGAWPAPRLAVLTLLGTALAAGAANALNSYLERDRDARMSRTRSRPLPTGRIRPRSALGFGIALGVLGTLLLGWAATPAAAAIALAAILFYVFVYTLWLKPRTPVCVILGGVSGAVAPLIADAAVDGRIGAAGWILFAIIFVWQPPHFWAISLYRQAEYESAGFPLLAGRIGAGGTRRRILLWALALIPVSLSPVALGLLGPLYAGVALGLGLWFAATCARLVRQADDAAARRVFRVSLLYLSGTFLCMIADLALRELA